jgi:chromate transporter
VTAILPTYLANSCLQNRTRRFGIGPENGSALGGARFSGCAAAVLIAFFGPTAALAFIVARLWRKLEKWPGRTSIQQGLAPVSIGLLLAGCFTMAKGAIGVETAAIAVGILLILRQYKVNPGLLGLGGAVIGMLSFAPK